MCAEDQRGAIRHLVQLFDEHRPQGPQPSDHLPVVHDFMAHVDGLTEQLYGAFNNLDGAIDTRTKTPRIGQYDAHR